MASAPFDTTIMLDFDSVPCQPDFAVPLLETFADSDVGFTVTLSEMFNVTGNQQYLVERNSAVMFLNMNSIRTRLLLSLYIQAFHIQDEQNLQPTHLKNYDSTQNLRSSLQKDQPALMVALQAMVEEFQVRKDQKPEVPNEAVRATIDKNGLGFLRHVDFDTSLICRKFDNADLKETPHCGEDSSCLIAHKADINPKK